MAAFREVSGVETWNGRIPRRGILPFQFRIIAIHQGPFVPLPFIEYQIRNCLFKRLRLISDYPLRADGTATDDVVSKGGDASMRQN